MDDNNQPTNDVNTQTETSTDGGSSPAEQTSDAPVTNETSTEVASETLADGTTKEDKTVPFTRLQQEIEKRAAAEERARILEQQRTQPQQFQQQQQEQNNPEQAQAEKQLVELLKKVAPQAGFISREEVQREQAVNEVKSEHTRLEGKYSGKDGLPKYESKAVTDYAINVLGMSNAKGLEYAYKAMHEGEIMNARIQAGIAKSRGIQSETSNGTGSANTGVSNDDLKKAANDGDQNAVHLLLKRRLASK